MLKLYHSVDVLRPFQQVQHQHSTIINYYYLLVVLVLIVYQHTHVQPQLQLLHQPLHQPQQVLEMYHV